MKHLEGRVRDVIVLLFQNLSAGTDVSHEKPVRIAAVPAETRTEDLPNTGPERYRRTNSFHTKENFNITAFWVVKVVRSSETSVTRDNLPEPQVSNNP